MQNGLPTIFIKKYGTGIYLLNCAELDKKEQERLSRPFKHFGLELDGKTALLVTDDICQTILFVVYFMDCVISCHFAGLALSPIL